MSINIFNVNVILGGIGKAASRLNPWRYVGHFLRRPPKRTFMPEFNRLEAALMQALVIFWKEYEAQSLARALAQLSDVKADLCIGHCVYRGPAVAWEIVEESLRKTLYLADDLCRTGRKEDVDKFMRKFPEELRETKLRIQKYLKRKQWQ